MNASPLLEAVVGGLAAVRLEAILIGNAAAAIQGAPVTTVDFDFMFRATPVNLTKLKKFATLLDAMILRPYYPIVGAVSGDERRPWFAGRFHAGHSRHQIIQQPSLARGKN